MKWAAIWALALLVLCSSIALAGEGAVISLLESAVVPGGDIALRQIAHIEGPPEVGEVVVGRAPFPGQSRRVHRGYVLVRLRQAGIKDAVVVGAEEVEVRTELEAAAEEPVQVLVAAVDIPYDEIISEDMAAQKSTNEIYKTLVEKLNYNEFEWQKKHRIPFRGKRLAEDIERLLYLCTECNAVNSIISRGNNFYCESCEKVYSINEYGTIDGSSHFSDTVAWNRWQMSHLTELIEKGFSFSNPQISLEKIEENSREKLQVLLVLQPDKLIIEYGDHKREVIAIQDISGLSITFLDMVEFFAGGIRYRFTFDPKKHMSVKLFYDLLITVREDRKYEF